MRVLIEGWDSGEPVRALLDAPDASQVRAAERVTLQFFDETASTSGGNGDGDNADGDGDADGDGNAKTTPRPPLRLLLSQQPHLLARSPPSLSSVVWDCGLALAEWLVEREAPQWRRRREGGGAAAAAEAGLTVVELGAGAGAPGLAAAASGLARAALLTDVGQQALRGLRANVTRNRLGDRVAVAELDWSSTGGKGGKGGSEGGGSQGGKGGGKGGSTSFDVSAASSGLLAPGSRPDLVLSADVCYPPPPDQKTTAGDAGAAAEALATAWAEAAASLCAPGTRVLVAFEARPEGVPGPEALRGFLLREARARFGGVERLDASGMAFAGAVELYQFSSVKM